MFSLSTALPPCSPTQYTDCKLITMSSTSTVLEMVMQTVTVSRILLCLTHIVPDTTPPPSDDLMRTLVQFLTTLLFPLAVIWTLASQHLPSWKTSMSLILNLQSMILSKTLSHFPTPYSYLIRGGLSYQKTPEDNSTSGDGGQYVSETQGCIDRGQQQR